MKRRHYKTCKFSMAAYSTYEYRVCSGEDLKHEKHAVCLWNLFMKNRKKGLRLKKTLRGKEISFKTVQINIKVVKEGDKKFDDIVGKKESAEPAETPSEIPPETPEKPAAEQPQEEKEQPKEEEKKE